mgnify:CR=1 FL=1
MAISVVRGLILKETNIGEADKILTVLVKDVGKISVSAKGARRTKGILSSGTSVFTYADFTIKTGSRHHFLSQVDIINSFFALTKDIFTLSYASYILELTDKTTSEGVPANDTLLLTINMLKRLAEHKMSPHLAAPVFELKILQYNGFMPNLEVCVGCGKEHNNIISVFGTLCTDCAQNSINLIDANEAVIYTMRHILAYEPPKLLDFSLNDELIKPLSAITAKMIDAHFGIVLKSKKFIESLNLY